MYKLLPNFQRKHRVAWADGLRGVAAILVVGYHYHIMLGINMAASWGSKALDATGTSYYQWYYLPPFRLFFGSGDAMVALFFIISGYVLSKKALSAIRDEEYDTLHDTLVPMMIRRPLRLWLPCTLTSFIGLLVVRSGLRNQYGTFHNPNETPLRDDLKLWLWETYARLSPVLPLQSSNTLIYCTFEDVLWTIPLEYYGSCAVFITLILLSRVKTMYRHALLFAFSVYSVFYHDYWFLGPFLMGMFFADVEPQTNLPIGYPLLGVAIFFCATPLPAGVITPLSAPLYEPFFKLVPNDVVLRFWSTFGAVLVFLCVQITPKLQDILSTYPLQFLGHISFSVYLIHRQVQDIIMYPILMPILRPLQHNAFLRILHYIFFWSFSLPLVLFISAWHEAVIDQNCLRITRYFQELIVQDGTKESSREMQSP